MLTAISTVAMIVDDAISIRKVRLRMGDVLGMA
jgi:hypothetical protein